MKLQTGMGFDQGNLIEFETLDSTNQWAMDHLKTLSHGDVVRAIRQTAGKGRFGRKWISSDDRALTLSIILKPNDGHDILTGSISQVAALAIASTLEHYALQAMVKWPNDVMIKGRKISGILAERDYETSLLVLGIGLNVNLTAEDFAGAELRQPATSMRIETGRDYELRDVMQTLLSKLKQTIQMLTGRDQSFPVLPWSQRDLLKGKRIQVHGADTMIAGTYSGIDESGRLKLTDDAGRQHLFWSGDISLGSENFNA